MQTKSFTFHLLQLADVESQIFITPMYSTTQYSISWCIQFQIKLLLRITAKI